jgi:isoquinoline 1-oxidoreductase beta subunit
VNTNQNGVYAECFMEEVARAAGRDSVEFRRSLMAKHPKHLAVLNAVAEKAGWGKPLPAGVHRGVAQFMGYGSYSAAVAEVSVSAQGQVKVHRMVLALDCGHAVNPHQIAAQVEGSVAYGLSATFYGEMNVEKRPHGRAQFPQLPDPAHGGNAEGRDGDRAELRLLGRGGEPTICVVAPSVMNAIFAATGKPVRSLPLKNLKLV